MIAFIPLFTLIAAVGSGLMAGLFFAFSSFIMTALAKLPPEQGIAAMNSINVTILNATFGLAFFGTALLCLGLGVVSILRWAEPGSAWLLIGSLIFLAGTIGVTMVFNVPLNDALAAVAPCEPGRRNAMDPLSRRVAAVEPCAHPRQHRRACRLHSRLRQAGGLSAQRSAGAALRSLLLNLVQNLALRQTPAANRRE